MNAGLHPKMAIRALVRQRLANTTPAERAAWSNAIRARLEALLASRAVESALLFHPTPEEPDILNPGIRTALQCAFPRMNWEQGTMQACMVTPDTPFEIRRHGIREPLAGRPVEPASLDAIVVPGIAFDDRGGRLGRGSGYYDRYLARLGNRPGNAPFLCGVCFEIQVWNAVPTEDHDVGLDALVTEARTISTR